MARRLVRIPVLPSTTVSEAATLRGSGEIAGNAGVNLRVPIHAPAAPAAPNTKNFLRFIRPPPVSVSHSLSRCEILLCSFAAYLAPSSTALFRSKSFDESRPSRLSSPTHWDIRPITLVIHFTEKLLHDAVSELE